MSKSLAVRRFRADNFRTSNLQATLPTPFVPFFVSHSPSHLPGLISNEGHSAAHWTKKLTCKAVPVAQRKDAHEIARENTKQAILQSAGYCCING
jgi:hypothetical protein